jgi:hypothetical protein
VQWPHRPDGGGGDNRPWRPDNGGNRPWRPDNGGNRPWRPNRPDGGGLRPERPGWNGPRPGGIWGNNNNNIGSGNIINSGNDNSITNVVNRQDYSTNINWGGGGWGSGWGGGWGSGWGGGWGSGWGGYVPNYYPQSYGSWFQGSWSDWPSYPSFWLGNSALGWMGSAAADTFSYANPYVAPSTTTVVQPVFNYSEPIPVYVEPDPVATTQPGIDPAAPAAPGIALPETTPAPEQPPEDPKVKEAVAILDEGRALFEKGDFAGAQAKVDKAIGVLPQDRVLHEFRALTLFAQEKFAEAATTLYAVLAAGPGWNWETIKTLYPDKEVYTKQLRALEAYARENPKAADARFVLAYHYLALDHKDAAVKMFQKVTELLPKDELSAAIVKALTQKPETTTDERPTAATG